MTQIVVNHITRMEGQRICVAGLDPESRRHLRPVTNAARPLTRDLLAESGGPFELAAVVDLGEVRRSPDRPEVEDVLFMPGRVRQVDRLGAARAWVARGDDVERHWLQVNGLCLEDVPLDDFS